MNRPSDSPFTGIILGDLSAGSITAGGGVELDGALPGPTHGNSWIESVSETVQFSSSVPPGGVATGESEATPGWDGGSVGVVSSVATVTSSSQEGGTGWLQKREEQQCFFLRGRSSSMHGEFSREHPRR